MCVLKLSTSQGGIWSLAVQMCMKLLRVPGSFQDDPDGAMVFRLEGTQPTLTCLLQGAPVYYKTVLFNLVTQWDVKPQL